MSRCCAAGNLLRAELGVWLLVLDDQQAQRTFHDMTPLRAAEAADVFGAESGSIAVAAVGLKSQLRGFGAVDFAKCVTCCVAAVRAS
jgi:hypothetical protein